MDTNYREFLYTLYTTDETAWLELSSRLISEGRHQDLDYDNLQEYLLSMAERDKRESRRRLYIFLRSLLAYQADPRLRNDKLIGSLLIQQRELQDLLESPTILDHARKQLGKEFFHAVESAALLTDLHETEFPSECPYSLEELMDRGLIKKMREGNPVVSLREKKL